MLYGYSIQLFTPRKGDQFLGPVYRYPDIFESATFSFLFGSESGLYIFESALQQSAKQQIRNESDNV